MKAIIFEPVLNDTWFPLNHQINSLMLPVGDKPLLYHIIKRLRNQGITSIKIFLYNHPEQVDKYFDDGKQFGVNISYYLQRKLFSYGELFSKIRSYIDDTLLIINPFGLSNMDFNQMSRFHNHKKAEITIAAKKLNNNNHPSIQFDHQSRITEFGEKKYTQGTDNVTSIGIIIAEPDTIYYNIGLINAVLKGDNVSNDYYSYNTFVYQTESYFSFINSPQELKSTTSDYLLRNIKGIEPEGYQIKNDNIYIHPSVKLNNPKKLKLQGPLLLGKDCSIGDSVKIKGPAIISDNSIISSNTSIIGSLIFTNTKVGKNLEINDALILGNNHLKISNKLGFVIDDKEIIDEVTKTKFPSKIASLLSGILDRTIALSALIFLSPLFIITSILIKLDSKGPIFYISKRVKKPELTKKVNESIFYNKEISIKYYVFRTMHVNANNQLNKLKNKYGDGPFVKVEDDPRVTRIGKFLRKTSIDELPLLFNVFRGEMSLVGIWGLPDYEAEYIQNKGFTGNKATDGLDLSEVARLRFEGNLGLAGLWQSRGRSDLSAEERAIHDSYQAVLSNNSDAYKEKLGPYAKYSGLRGYIEILFDTIKSVILRKGAI